MGGIRIAVLALVIGLPLAATPLLVNGGFETGPAPGAFTTLAGGNTSMTGWTVTGHSIDYIGSYWQPGEGNRSVDLNGSGVGGVEQSVAGFDIGTAYLLTFLMSGNPDGAPVVKNLRVTISGLGSADFSFNTTGVTRSNMGWELKTFGFVATATTHLINFSSLDLSPAFFGAAIDDVRIGEVPEPTAFGLLGAGLLLFGLARIPRKRQ